MGETDLIELPLSNHLEWPAGSGEHHKPGTKLKVSRQEAESLIAAGYVAVNPTDVAAVSKLLGRETEPAEAPAKPTGKAPTAPAGS